MRAIIRSSLALTVLIITLKTTTVSAASFQFTSGWTNDGAGYAPAQAARQGTLCAVSGLVRTTNKSVPTKAIALGTLSSNCRPAARLIFNLNDNDLTARVDIHPDGTVIWRSGFKRFWVSLSGITFGVGKPTALSLNTG